MKIKKDSFYKKSLISELFKWFQRNNLLSIHLL